MCALVCTPGRSAPSKLLSGEHPSPWRAYDSARKSQRRCNCASSLFQATHSAPKNPCSTARDACVPRRNPSTGSKERRSQAGRVNFLKRATKPAARACGCGIKAKKLRLASKVSHNGHPVEKRRVGCWGIFNVSPRNGSPLKSGFARRTSSRSNKVTSSNHACSHNN